VINILPNRTETTRNPEHNEYYGKWTMLIKKVLERQNISSTQYEDEKYSNDGVQFRVHEPNIVGLHKFRQYVSLSREY
jgi:hypothetical protein